MEGKAYMRKINLECLETEMINPKTKKIDTCSFLEIVELINQEDKGVAYAVEQQKQEIANLIEASFLALKQGGRLIYIGAGTSGRLGVLDASECPPTYGVDHQLVMGIIAGGDSAMFKAAEGIEDLRASAIKDLENIELNKSDMLIGIAASGRTPYVISALQYANRIGAFTGSISCVSNAELSSYAKYPVEVITGPEVISGSTRMKAATAQKMILNMISTACMVKLGKVYQNLMVDVQSTNEKLIQRAKRLIGVALECDEQKAEQLYELCYRNVKLAILVGISQLEVSDAESLLEKYNGHISDALRSLGRL